MNNLPLPLLSLTADENVTNVNVYSHWLNTNERKNRDVQPPSSELPYLTLPYSSDPLQLGTSLVENQTQNQTVSDSLKSGSQNMKELKKMRKKKKKKKRKIQTKLTSAMNFRVRSNEQRPFPKQDVEEASRKRRNWRRRQNGRRKRQDSGFSREIRISPMRTRRSRRRGRRRFRPVSLRTYSGEWLPTVFVTWLSCTYFLILHYLASPHLTLPPFYFFFRTLTPRLRTTAAEDSKVRLLSTRAST